MPSTDVFIVSGAGGGIGHGIAHHLLEKGHSVFGFGRDEAKLRAAADGFATPNFGFAAADLSRADQVADGIARARAWIDGRPLRGLVNNAGVFRRASFLNTDDDEWTRYFTNNLLSAVRLARGFHADLKAAAGASVLMISSTLGIRPVVDTLAYSALKAAMNNLTAGLALEWAPDQIRVNCICPGIVDTPIHAYFGHADDPARTGAAGLHPLGRLGQPADVALAAAYLLSNDAAWTTGVVLPVDGGIVL